MQDGELPRFRTIVDFLKLPADLTTSYSDVVMQVYPLSADLAALTRFCDGYLNLDQAPPAKFKPAAPWVLMQAVNYGEIAAKTQHIGWFSQHELAFGFPVECYERENGDWVFKDWALLYPFIYVDNPLSMSGGRQIYGWPKAEIRFNRPLPDLEPSRPRRLVTVSLVPESGKRMNGAALPKFLEVFQRRPFISGRSGALDLFMAVPRAIAGSFAAAYNLLESATASYAGYASRDLRSLQEMTSRLFDYATAWLPAGSGIAPSRTRAKAAGRSGLSSESIITLKQFRDAREPSSACYQAILRSKMSIEAALDGGPLFDPISGDPTGGISISLLSTEDQPVVTQLGLRASSDDIGSDKSGQPRFSLRPVMPFWAKLNISYGTADYQCWRTRETAWSTGDRPEKVPARSIKYVTLGSGAKLEVEGPIFNYHKVWLRVLPLKVADHDKLQKTCREYLENEFYKFELTPSRDGRFFVYALIGNFNHMMAETPEGHPAGGPFADRVLTFAVPARFSEDRAPSRRAWIPLYTFVGSEWNFVTDAEVYGRLTLLSRLKSPPNTWMEDPDPAPRSETGLLKLSTMLFPEDADQLGWQARELPLITVCATETGRGEVATSASETPTRTSSASDYVDQLDLGPYFSGKGVEPHFYSIALKQVRDAKRGDRAAYQSLVGVPTTVRKSEFKYEARPLVVRVYKYPSADLVETMCLAAREDELDGKRVYVIKPEAPFYVTCSMRDLGGQTLCWRAGALGWQRG